MKNNGVCFAAKKQATNTGHLMAKSKQMQKAKFKFK
jgi:hypothetical protein